MPKKLLYITNGVNGPGGLERVLSIKLNYLIEHFGYEIHVITLNQASSDLFYNFNKNITYHNITATGKLKYIVNYIKSLRKLVKKINPDIISVCDDGFKGLFVPLYLGKPCPMIYERHVSKNIEIKKEHHRLRNKIIMSVKFKIMDWGGSLYNRFVVLTNGNKKEWRLKNLMVISNPLTFFPEAHQTSQLKNKKVMAVGKQSFQKGYDRLLESWKLVHKKHPDWELNIYGTINSDLQLEAQVKTLNISRTVHFYPPVKNILEKYQEASIYVMSSRFEGFGMVLTEAMAYGVPCVSFDCPYGPSDIITHGENGYLVKNGDTIKLAEYMNYLIENPTLRTDMGSTARLSVARFLPEIIAAQWHELFKQLINN